MSLICRIFGHNMNLGWKGHGPNQHLVQCCRRCMSTEPIKWLDSMEIVVSQEHAEKLT